MAFVSDKKKFRKVIIPLIIAVLSITLLIIGCPGYLIRVGKGQLSILLTREPIETVINNPATSSEIRQKLIHVIEVRKFAKNRLGLSPGNSYSEYAEIDRKAAAWNVTASEALALKPYTWWFPIVGKVPYLGFFSRSEAEKESTHLRKMGWDTLVRPVSGYSTLGWFDDPILSTQLRYSDWYIARLVIHEVAHSTIWFPGDVNFNESFASFVEEKGALLFYREKDGATSKKYKRKENSIKESKRLTEIFTEYAGKLHALYEKNIPVKQKRAGKEKTIKSLKNKLLKILPEFDIIDIKQYAVRDYNNAHFLTYMRYGSGREFFNKIFQKHDGKWKNFLKEMRHLRLKTVVERKRLLSNVR